MALDPNVQNVLDRYVAGEIADDDLPSVAFELLSESCQAESLIQLAGCDDASRERKRELFLAGLNEMNWALPSSDDAAFRFSLLIMRDILAGEISAYDGARKIWWNIYNDYQELSDLRIFVGCASEYEDSQQPDAKAYYEELIRDACRDLLDEHEGTGLGSKVD